MINELTYYTRVLSIVGDVLQVRATDVGLGDLAIVDNFDGEQSLAQVVQLRRDEVSLQVFSGGKGISTEARVRFLGHGTRSVENCAKQIPG